MSKTMRINRRGFLMLTTSAVVTGCRSVNDNGAVVQSGRVVNAGPVVHYAADGVYTAFRNQGFFIVRQGGKLFALSATCTPKKSKLDAEPDHPFSCPCHGSTFDPIGHVTQGPAKRDLPAFATSVEGSGQLLVTI